MLQEVSSCFNLIPACVIRITNLENSISIYVHEGDFGYDAI